MDYNNIQYNQIKHMDYWGLVNTLTNQISPETRSMVLDKLVEMNNSLLTTSSGVQMDLSRSTMLNSRKKDVTEIQHPSLDLFNNKGANPLPMGLPTSYNQMVNNQMTSGHNQMTTNHNQMTSNYNQIEDIDLDDIIEDVLNDEVDDLDSKLNYIKNLHSKIITDRRNKRASKKN